jgi:hypothetical protein
MQYSSSQDEEECDSSEELMSAEPQVVQSRIRPPQRQDISSADSTMFRLQFLGSVEVDEEGGRKRRKRLKNHMVEEAVTKIKVQPRPAA